MEKRIWDWQKEQLVSEARRYAESRDAARAEGDEARRRYCAGYLGGIYTALHMLGFAIEFAEDGTLEDFE